MIRIIVVFGLPGTGKSTFAAALARALDAEHFNTDRVRHELGKRGKYSEEAKADIYRHMFEMAAETLDQKRNVILDGTFYKADLRSTVTSLAQQFDAALDWIEIAAPEETIRNRVGHKREYSEADFDVYQKVKDAFEPLTVPHLKLDSQQKNIAEMVADARSYLDLHT